MLNFDLLTHSKDTYLTLILANLDWGSTYVIVYKANTFKKHRFYKLHPPNLIFLEYDWFSIANTTNIIVLGIGASNYA